MFTMCGHPNMADITQFDKDLYLISCGYDENNHQQFNIKRPNGRNDFHIVYMVKGCGHFLINDKFHKVDEGHFILYKPLEKQEYFFSLQRMFQDIGYILAVCKREHI